MQTTNAARFSPKTASLPGSVHAEYSRCNRAGCRCLHGDRHGPYYRRYWREDGRTRRQYIPLAQVSAVIAACNRYHELHPSGRAVRRMLRDVDQLTDEVLTLVAALGAGDQSVMVRNVAQREEQP